MKKKYLNLLVQPTASYDDGQRKNFEKLVLSGGQVNKNRLSDRIARAHYLALLYIDDELVGTNAVKNNPDHRQTVENNSGVSLANHEYLGEVGWLYVVETRRRRGLGDLLMSAILAITDGSGLFATIRSKNTGARLLHERHRFKRVGKSWPSDDESDMVYLLPASWDAQIANAVVGGPHPLPLNPPCFCPITILSRAP